MFNVLFFIFYTNVLDLSFLFVDVIWSQNIGGI